MPVDCAAADRHRLGHLDDDVGGDVDGRRSGDRRRHRRADVVVIAEEIEGQCHSGNRDGSQFQPVLEGLDEGDRAHPTADDVGDDDDSDRNAPDPAGNTEQDVERQPRALELRNQIQDAHHRDHEHRELAQSR